MEGPTSADDPLQGHRLEFDESLASLIQNAQQMLAAQNRLQGLLHASKAITEELDLDTVLRRIVEVACDLVDADYGALGVIRPDRHGLERFVHVGIDEAIVATIGDLPHGRGLLGLLIEDPRPIRLTDPRTDSHSFGFPAHHPAMHAFLGVPISVRGEVFGNLYLTRTESKEFTQDDEGLVLALAATAGTAIENARLFEDGRRRQDWLDTATAVTRQVLAEEDPLRIIAKSVIELADADIVMIAQPNEDQHDLVIAVAVGHFAEDVSHATYPLKNTLSELVLAMGEPLRVADVADTHQYGDRTVFLAEKADIGPAMVLPLVGAADVRGVLWVARGPGKRPFTAADQEMAATFANHAAVAWELASARRDQHRMEMLEDRGRIARDLHDHVIQRLFGAGLSLQGVAPRAGDAREVVEHVVDDLDDVIKQIRSTIFQLRPTAGGMRAAVIDVVEEARSALGFSPSIVFHGVVDKPVTDALRNDVTAVLRESLTNVAKHAQATAADVALTVSEHSFRLVVTDNGVGVGDIRRSSGLGNIRSRAEALGGEATVTGASSGSGTVVEWRVPLPSATH